LLGHCAGETPLVQRNPRQDPDVALEAEWKEVFFRALVEDVVDDLDGVDEAGADQLEGGIRLVIVDGDAQGADLAGTAELFEGAAPLVLVEPFGVPDVELLEVDGVEAEVA
jgi:hypothetical protein